VLEQRTRVRHPAAAPELSDRFAPGGGIRAVERRQGLLACQFGNGAACSEHQAEQADPGNRPGSDPRNSQRKTPRKNTAQRHGVLLHGARRRPAP
jgi:hypothetical protein